MQLQSLVGAVHSEVEELCAHDATAETLDDGWIERLVAQMNIEELDKFKKMDVHRVVFRTDVENCEHVVWIGAQWVVTNKGSTSPMIKARLVGQECAAQHLARRTLRWNARPACLEVLDPGAGNCVTRQSRQVSGDLGHKEHFFAPYIAQGNSNRNPSRKSQS